MRFVVLTALPLLAACAGGSSTGSSSGPAPVAFQGGTPYVCDTGEAVRADRQGNGMGLVLDDGTALSLPQVNTSSSGTTYGSDGWVWFVTGDTAILTQQGGQVNCRVSTQEEYDAAWEKRQPLIGQEPVAGFNPPETSL